MTATQQAGDGLSAFLKPYHDLVRDRRLIDSFKAALTSILTSGGTRLSQMARTTPTLSEITQSLRTVGVARLIFVLDRGFDDLKLVRPLRSLSVDVVIRARHLRRLVQTARDGPVQHLGEVFHTDSGKFHDTYGIFPSGASRKGYGFCGMEGQPVPCRVLRNLAESVSDLARLTQV